MFLHIFERIFEISIGLKANHHNEIEILDYRSFHLVSEKKEREQEGDRIKEKGTTQTRVSYLKRFVFS
jgi:hypothetical protein